MLWLPKWLREDDAPPAPLPRRKFIFDMGALVVGAAVAPYIPMSKLGTLVYAGPAPVVTLVGGFTTAQAERLMREVMLPKAMEYIRQENILLHYIEEVQG